MNQALQATLMMAGVLVAVGALLGWVWLCAEWSWHIGETAAFAIMFLPVVVALWLVVYWAVSQ